MKVIDFVAAILKLEGTEFLSCYPTTDIIDAAAAVGIRPIICRQERVGMGIADGFSRVTNGKRIGVFAMQAGPGSENAFPGIASAYSDSSPVLIVPSGYPRDRENWPRYFTAPNNFKGITKWLEQVNTSDQVSESLRRAFSRLRNGRPGPVLVEFPTDLAAEETSDTLAMYQCATASRSGADPSDIERAADALINAECPVIHAGQGVLYAEASSELQQLAELLDAPVVTTLLGKSAFPETHPLSVGTAGGANGTSTRAASHYLRESDVLLGAGCSFTRHAMSATVPDGKTLIHVTNDESDINKNYPVQHPLIGDAKLVLAQLVDAVSDRNHSSKGRRTGSRAQDIHKIKSEWLKEWEPILTSSETPITPYRVITELMNSISPDDAIVTHDSGSPRDQMVPFYQSGGPRSYIGWGKSHALGAGLGYTIGAKLASPDKVCINWMGDAAFGMVGMDFETAVRCEIPILTIVSNNSSMAIEIPRMPVSHELYRARDVGGSYAELARALGGFARKVEDPNLVADSIREAINVTKDGQPALLEIITSEEARFSRG